MDNIEDNRGGTCAELMSSTAALPNQAPTASDAKTDGTSDDALWAQFNFDQVCVLEQANAELICEGLRIDPNELNLSPCVRFWSHVCMEHGNLIAEVFAHGIPARTIVVALQEAQEQLDAAPCMDEIAAKSAELATQLRAAVTDPGMSVIWSPSAVLERAAEFHFEDAAAQIEDWDMENVQDLFDLLMDIVELHTATGVALADYVDIDHLPSVALPTGCTGENIWVLDRQGQVIAGSALTRTEARVMRIEACDWAFPKTQ
ncbi:MAG: hypothetical protein ACU0A8_15095 [Limimaricola soesokkakensis]|uniref:hypothetical protein n=1 Tax=Limimaricola soesokkakensis TaxID=1343159 RepID=UPI0040593A5A